MIQIEDKIISMDVFEKYFLCDLSACKGACCVEGDSGAPLIDKEEEILKDIYEKVKPYMRKEGITEIENQGIAVFDDDGDLTTPLVENKECAFVFFENGITKCSIEKAYIDGETKIIESNLSKIPPCPFKILLESFIPASRFNKDSKKSPNCPTIPVIIPIKMISFERNNSLVLKKL